MTNSKKTEGLSMVAAPVVWITGYSSAGKTTVGRIVCRKLQDLGANPVFLDGDDLRSILGNQHGFDKESRIELARVYLRLCSHLASQGVPVVIAAVAMYDEIFRWFKEFIPYSFLVYLDVPESIRKHRDNTTKQLYGLPSFIQSSYEEPKIADLVIENDDRYAPEKAAMNILKAIENKSYSATADRGKSRHWNEFYSAGDGIELPSSFAEMVGGKIKPRSRIIEVGCGNGRDAFYFQKCGHDVLAIDPSDAAIKSCLSRSTGNIRFECGKIDRFAKEKVAFADVVYSRFCIHAMNALEETEFLQASAKLLRPSGHIFIECRSIKDPLARLGEVLSPTERIYGHYRRFIVADELVHKMEVVGFRILNLIEARDLAIHNDDNPCVIRVEATVE